VALNLEMEAAEERRGPLNDRVEELQAEFDRARGVLNAAKNELHELIYGELSDLRRGISEAEKRLAALENETPVEAAPAVRSGWQLREALGRQEEARERDQAAG
jgi:predicted  nucleic acid-binding Zn-ribbon protein